jgi:hypothetical protein
MELHEMKSIWQAYDNKLDKSLQLNLHCLEMIQAQKLKNKLRPLFWYRGIEICLYVVVMGWLVQFLAGHSGQTKIILAAGVLLVYFSIALASCIKQFLLLQEVDLSDDILSIQKKLTLLQSHIVDYLSLAFLAFPTYLAYPVIAFEAVDAYRMLDMSHNWWIANIVFSILITPICIWLYQQISYKNIHKNWVRNFVRSSAGIRVARALEFVKEVDQLKKENI